MTITRRDKPKTTDSHESVGVRATSSDSSSDKVGGASNTSRNCLVILTVLAVFYTLYFGRALLVPITMAVVLSLVLRPVVAFFARFHVPNVVTASGLFLGVLGLVIATTMMLSAPAQSWLAQAPRNLSDVGRQLRPLSEPIAKVQEARKKVDEITTVPGEEKAVRVRLEQPSVTGETLNATGGYLTSVAITLVLLFFLLAAGDRLLEKAVEAAPSWQHKRGVVEKFREIESRVSKYLGTVTLINLGLGLMIGCGLGAIEMPNPMLWGVLAAGLNFVPVAGAFVGAATVGLAALSVFPDSLGQAMIAPGIYLAANMIESNLITPLLLGKSTNLNPIAILLAVFLFGWIWGIVGIFLAVPLLIVAKIFCTSYDSLRPYGVLLSN